MSTVSLTGWLQLICRHKYPQIHYDTVSNHKSGSCNLSPGSCSNIAKGWLEGFPGIGEFSSAHREELRERNQPVLPLISVVWRKHQIYKVGHEKKEISHINKTKIHFLNISLCVPDWKEIEPGGLKEAVVGELNFQFCAFHVQRVFITYILSTRLVFYF